MPFLSDLPLYTEGKKEQEYCRRHNGRRKGRDNFMVTDRGEKQAKKGAGGNGRKKPVKIVVKQVYTGKQDMAEVFGSVALENIRRKMRGD